MTILEEARVQSQTYSMEDAWLAEVRVTGLTRSVGKGVNKPRTSRCWRASLALNGARRLFGAGGAGFAGLSSAGPVIARPQALLIPNPRFTMTTIQFDTRTACGSIRRPDTDSQELLGRWEWYFRFPSSGSGEAKVRCLMVPFAPYVPCRCACCETVRYLSST